MKRLINYSDNYYINKINYLKKKLHKQINKDKGKISDKALVISQELDEFIVEYIKYKNNIL